MLKTRESCQMENHNEHHPKYEKYFIQNFNYWIIQKLHIRCRGNTRHSAPTEENDLGPSSPDTINKICSTHSRRKLNYREHEKIHELISRHLR